MLIICAGRSRSGSTLSYNLVRLALIHIFGKKNVYGRGWRYYDKDISTEIHVVKIHGYRDYFWDNADFVFSSIRDKEEQKSSIFKFQKVMKHRSLSDAKIEEIIKYDHSRYKKWVTHKNFVKTFDFNELVCEKEMVIKFLFKIFLFDDYNDDDISKIICDLNNIRFLGKGYDPETCMTSSHFTSEKMIKKANKDRLEFKK